MASECSTSHMTPHIYWFLCTRKGSRHGPWNSLVLYLGEIIAVKPVPTGRLALDFTSYYRFSPYYIHLTNFIHQLHSAVTETTVKQRPLAFILFESPNFDGPHHCYFSAVSTSCRRHQLPGSRAGHIPPLKIPLISLWRWVARRPYKVLSVISTNKAW